MQNLVAALFRLEKSHTRYEKNSIFRSLPSFVLAAFLGLHLSGTHMHRPKHTDQSTERKDMSFLDKAKEVATSIADKAAEAGHTVATTADAAATKAGEAAHQVGASIAGGASTLADQAASLAHSAVDATKSAGAAGLSALEKATGIDINKDGKIG